MKFGGHRAAATPVYFQNMAVQTKELQHLDRHNFFAGQIGNAQSWSPRFAGLLAHS